MKVSWSNTVIVHMDMDAFFASVEERANPALRGLPMVVSGPGERSIITTASYPARSFGVRTGMTVRQARVLCRDLVIVRSDYKKYSDASKKIMAILETFTPDVQATSVDEAFLDAGSLMKRYADPLILGRDIKESVRAGTGLTCSVGIAHNRLLAKLASGMKKPDGLTWLKPEMVKEVLERTPVEKLCGIGPVTTKALKLLGIRTCGQLGRHPVEILRGRFGSLGNRLSLMGRGEGEIYPERDGTGQAQAKSIGHSVTLPEDISDRQSMGKVLQTLSEMVGRRARRNSCRGRTLTLTWRYDDFSTRTSRTTLNSPVCLTEEIYQISSKMLQKVEVTRPIRLLGISLSDLTVEEYTPSLLPETRKKEDIQKALDTINDRFGEFTLAFGESIPDLRRQKVISPSWRAKGIKDSL